MIVNIILSIVLGFLLIAIACIVFMIRSLIRYRRAMREGKRL